MKTSPRGIEDLISSEGLRLTAYRDSVGVWTIGYGHAATSGRAPIPKAGMTITKQEAMDILKRDLAEAYEPAVNAVLPNVPQHVFDGAVSFHFNTGAIRKAAWVGKYKAGPLPGQPRRHRRASRALLVMITLLCLSGLAACAAIALHGVADSHRRRLNRPPVDLRPAAASSEGSAP